MATVRFVRRAQEHARRTGVSVEEAFQTLSTELSDDELDRVIHKVEEHILAERGQK